jgi:hypothetical protein
MDQFSRLNAGSAFLDISSPNGIPDGGAAS